MRAYTRALHQLKPWTRYGRECKHCDRRSLMEACDGCRRYERWQERATGRGLLFALARTSTALIVFALLGLAGCNGEDSKTSLGAAWWIRDCPAPQDAPWLDETVILKITFRFVGDPTVQCGQWGERLACSWSDGTIEIASRVDADGRIVFPTAILGHEVEHQLAYFFPHLFPNPDTW